MEDDKDLIEQHEPNRKTLLDVLRDNLKLANKMTFVHRLIYIGEHRHVTGIKTLFSEAMKTAIRKVNEGYRDDYLSGIFLLYPRYFCHILEGTEDSLVKHLVLLTSNSQNCRRIGRMKMLVCYHHINQRFLTDWMVVTGTPPALLERINSQTDISSTSRFALNCIKKLYKLALAHQPKLKRKKKSPVDNPVVVSKVSPKKAEDEIGWEENPDCLPENGLIRFLLTTPYTQDLRHYIDIYGIIKPFDFYKDKVWPVPPEFLPDFLFEKQYDPIPHLPTATYDVEGVLQYNAD